MTSMLWRDIYPTLAHLDGGAPTWLDDPVQPDHISYQPGEAATLFLDEQWTMPLGQLMPALHLDPVQPLRWLPVDTRWANAMARYEYLTIGDILDLSIADQADIRNLGRTSIRQAVAVLAVETVDLALQSATAPAQAEPEPIHQLLDQVTDHDLADRLRAAIAQQGIVTSPGPAGTATDLGGMVRQRANRMASMYRAGISLADIADHYQATAGWVRHTIVRYSDWEFPELTPDQTGRRSLPGDVTAARQRKAAQQAREAEKAAERQARLELNQARGREMARQLAQPGMTLDAVGKLHGITRERVRQIINEYSGTNVPAIVEQRKAAEEQAHAEFLARLTPEALAWSEQNPGAPLQEAADLFGTDTATISGVLGARRGLHHAPNEHTVSVWTNDQLLDLLRRYHTETGRIDGEGFEEWGRPNGYPTRQLIAVRFRRWNLALQAAGVADAEPVRHAQVYSDNDLWAAVVEFLAGQPDRYSYVAYTDWQQGVPGAPSAALLRFRLGLKWSEMRSSAAAALAGDPNVDPEWAADITTRRDWAEFRNGALSRDEALRIVRQAIDELGPSISNRAYQEWAKANGQPAEATVVRASGLPVWRDVLLAAGGAERPPRPALLSDEQLDAALVEFFTEYPNGTSIEWGRWCTGVPGRPALQTLDRRYGSWRDAKKRGMQLAAAGAGE